MEAVLVAGFRNYDQPCEEIVDLTANAVVADIEVYLPAQTPIEATMVFPRVTGTVYEETASGRRGVSGVKVFGADGGDWKAYAHTTTDAEGHYVLCNLRHVLEIAATRDGFQSNSTEDQLFNGASQVVRDIEIKRTR